MQNLNGLSFGNVWSYGNINKFTEDFQKASGEIANNMPLMPEAPKTGPNKEPPDLGLTRYLGSTGDVKLKEASLSNVKFTVAQFKKENDGALPETGIDTDVSGEDVSERLGFNVNASIDTLSRMMEKKVLSENGVLTDAQRDAIHENCKTAFEKTMQAASLNLTPESLTVLARSDAKSDEMRAVLLNSALGVAELLLRGEIDTDSVVSLMRDGKLYDMSNDLDVATMLKQTADTVKEEFVQEGKLREMLAELKANVGKPGGFSQGKYEIVEAQVEELIAARKQFVRVLNFDILAHDPTGKLSDKEFLAKQLQDAKLRLQQFRYDLERCTGDVGKEFGHAKFSFYGVMEKLRRSCSNWVGNRHLKWRFGSNGERVAAFKTLMKLESQADEMFDLYKLGDKSQLGGDALERMRSTCQMTHAANNGARLNQADAERRRAWSEFGNTVLDQLHQSGGTKSVKTEISLSALAEIGTDKLVSGKVSAGGFVRTNVTVSANPKGGYELKFITEGGGKAGGKVSALKDKVGAGLEVEGSHGKETIRKFRSREELIKFCRQHAPNLLKSIFDDKAFNHLKAQMATPEQIGKDVQKVLDDVDLVRFGNPQEREQAIKNLKDNLSNLSSILKGFDEEYQLGDTLDGLKGLISDLSKGISDIKGKFPEMKVPEEFKKLLDGFKGKLDSLKATIGGVISKVSTVVSTTVSTAKSVVKAGKAIAPTGKKVGKFLGNLLGLRIHKTKNFNEVSFEHRMKETGVFGNLDSLLAERKNAVADELTTRWVTGGGVDANAEVKLSKDGEAIAGGSAGADIKIYQHHLDSISDENADTRDKFKKMAYEKGRVAGKMIVQTHQGNSQAIQPWKNTDAIQFDLEISYPFNPTSILTAAARMCEEAIAQDPGNDALAVGAQKALEKLAEELGKAVVDGAVSGKSLDHSRHNDPESDLSSIGGVLSKVGLNFVSNTDNSTHLGTKLSLRFEDGSFSSCKLSDFVTNAKTVDIGLKTAHAPVGLKFGMKNVVPQEQTTMEFMPAPSMTVLLGRFVDVLKSNGDVGNVEASKLLRTHQSVVNDLIDSLRKSDVDPSDVHSFRYPDPALENIRKDMMALRDMALSTDPNRRLPDNLKADAGKVYNDLFNTRDGIWAKLSRPLSPLEMDSDENRTNQMQLLLTCISAGYEIMMSAQQHQLMMSRYAA